MSRLDVIQIKAGVRLWRKQVRWLYGDLLRTGHTFTMKFDAPSLGIAVVTRVPTVLQVTDINPSQRTLCKINDYIVGINERDLTLEELTSADLRAIVATVPIPFILHASRLSMPRAKDAKRISFDLNNIKEKAKALEAQGREYEVKLSKLYRFCRDDEVEFIQDTIKTQTNVLQMILQKCSMLLEGISYSKETRLCKKLDEWTFERQYASIDKLDDCMPVLTKSLQNFAIQELEKCLDISWLSRYPPTDLKWLTSRENKVRTLLRWFTTAFEIDLPRSQAVDTAQQVTRQLVRHYNGIWTTNMLAQPGTVEKDFLAHARKLKSNLGHANNGALRKNLAQGQLSMGQLMTMSHDELAPPQILKERQEYVTQAMQNTIIKEPVGGKALIKTKNGFKEVALPGAVPDNSPALPPTHPTISIPTQIISEGSSSPITDNSSRPPLLSRTESFKSNTSPVTNLPTISPFGTSPVHRIAPSPRETTPKPSVATEKPWMFPPPNKPSPNSKDMPVDLSNDNDTDTRPSKRQKVASPLRPSRMEEMVIDDLRAVSTSVHFIRAVFENSSALERRLGELVTQVRNSKQYSIGSNVMASVKSSMLNEEYVVDVTIGGYFFRIIAQSTPSNQYAIDEAKHQLVTYTRNLRTRWSEWLVFFTERIAYYKKNTPFPSDVGLCRSVLDLTSHTRYIKLDEKNVNNEFLCLVRVHKVILFTQKAQDANTARTGASKAFANFLLKLVEFHPPAREKLLDAQKST